MEELGDDDSEDDDEEFKQLDRLTPEELSNRAGVLKDIEMVTKKSNERNNDTWNDMDCSEEVIETRRGTGLKRKYVEDDDDVICYGSNGKRSKLIQKEDFQC